jgi:hypothetical protein
MHNEGNALVQSQYIEKRTQVAPILLERVRASIGLRSSPDVVVCAHTGDMETHKVATEAL